MIESTNKLSLSFDNLKKPFMAYFKISNICNLGCFFCSQNCNATEFSTMNLNKAKKYLDQLYGFGVINIIYTGGEPLLYKDILELLKYGHELGLKQSIVTNGMFLNRMIEILPYITNIGISLHGDKEIHNKITGNQNSYNLAIDNIIKLRTDYNFPVNINYTFNNLNESKESLTSVKQLCDKYGVSLSVARLNYIGNAQGLELQDLNKLCSIVDSVNNETLETNKIKFSNCMVPCLLSHENKKFAHGCGAGISFIAVENNGDVKICASSKRVLGNLNKTSLTSILKNKALKEWKTAKNLHSSCKNCPSVLQCKGGCRVECENENFNKEIYDSYLINKIKTNQQLVLNSKLQLKTDSIIFEKNKIIIPISPVRIVDKKFYTIIEKLSGDFIGQEIINSLPEKMKESSLQLLTTLYIEGLIYAKRI